jgi:hypothetical protein
VFDVVVVVLVLHSPGCAGGWVRGGGEGLGKERFVFAMERLTDVELLQRYRRDRRELLNFLLAASVIKKVVMPPGAVSYEDIDLDQISVDYILECVRKSESEVFFFHLFASILLFCLHDPLTQILLFFSLQNYFLLSQICLGLFFSFSFFLGFSYICFWDLNTTHCTHLRNVAS